MARQVIMREQVPSYIFNMSEFRWGQLTGYTSYQGDYIIKVGKDIMAIFHEDEDEPRGYRFWLDEDFVGFEDTRKYVRLVKQGRDLWDRGFGN